MNLVEDHEYLESVQSFGSQGLSLFFFCCFFLLSWVLLTRPCYIFDCFGAYLLLKLAGHCWFSLPWKALLFVIELLLLLKHRNHQVLACCLLLLVVWENNVVIFINFNRDAKCSGQLYLHLLQLIYLLEYWVAIDTGSKRLEERNILVHRFVTVIKPLVEVTQIHKQSLCLKNHLQSQAVVQFLYWIANLAESAYPQFHILWLLLCLALAHFVIFLHNYLMVWQKCFVDWLCVAALCFESLHSKKPPDPSLVSNEITSHLGELDVGVLLNEPC